MVSPISPKTSPGNYYWSPHTCLLRISSFATLGARWLLKEVDNAAFRLFMGIAHNTLHQDIRNAIPGVRRQYLLSRQTCTYTTQAKQGSSETQKQTHTVVAQKISSPTRLDQPPTPAPAPAAFQISSLKEQHTLCHAEDLANLMKSDTVPSRSISISHQEMEQFLLFLNDSVDERKKDGIEVFRLISDSAVDQKSHTTFPIILEPCHIAELRNLLSK